MEIEDSASVSKFKDFGSVISFLQVEVPYSIFKNEITVGISQYKKKIFQRN
jgi:hypothetical protein